MMLKQIKYLFLFLLTFLLGVQTTYAKTELILPQNQVPFSIEQDQSFKRLEKELQPNIGFLKEKYRFVLSESVSARNQYEFSQSFVGYLANSVDDVDNLFPLIKNHPDFQGFKNLCTNNPKVSIKLAGDKWAKFVTSTKSTFGIGSKRNIVKMEFDGKEYLIASGKGYNGQMTGSGKFIPEEFVLDIDKGQRVFTPSISTRHLDTESLGLEYFAKSKNAVEGVEYPNVTGKVKITSDLCPCPSCSAIFQQFSDMFPNVTIDIITTTKLHY